MIRGPGGTLFFYPRNQSKAAASATRGRRLVSQRFMLVARRSGSSFDAASPGPITNAVALFGIVATLSAMDKPWVPLVATPLEDGLLTRYNRDQPRLRS